MVIRINDRARIPFIDDWRWISAGFGSLLQVDLTLAYDEFICDVVDIVIVSYIYVPHRLGNSPLTNAKSSTAISRINTVVLLDLCILLRLFDN